MAELGAAPGVRSDACHPAVAGKTNPMVRGLEPGNAGIVGVICTVAIRTRHEVVIHRIFKGSRR